VAALVPIIADTKRRVLYESRFAPRWDVPLADIDESPLSLPGNSEKPCTDRAPAATYSSMTHSGGRSYPDAIPSRRKSQKPGSFATGHPPRDISRHAAPLEGRARQGVSARPRSIATSTSRGRSTSDATRGGPSRPLRAARAPLPFPSSGADIGATTICERPDFRPARYPMEGRTDFNPGIWKNPGVVAVFGSAGLI